MNKQRFTYLMDQLVRKAISAEETAELQDLLNDLDHLELPEALSETWLRETLDIHRLPADHDEADKQAEAILAVDKSFDLPRLRHVRFFAAAWFRYAAAIVLLFAAGGFFWKIVTKDHSSMGEAGLEQTQKHPVPAKEGAVLTLADGTRVPLDSAENGVLATQNGTQVVLKNGSLTYNSGGNPSAEMTYNSVATPNGRQFQLILPDKSKVWLNAASSIRYPTAFSGDQRVVEIKGEAYFEIERDQHKPFKVKITDAAAVEVLGTSFNVNAYEGEDAIRTTLIAGAVRLNTSKPLRPGQQARLYPNETMKIVDGVNVDQIVAWKNGYFDFDKADLQVMMRQLERWYDITVKYKGSPPNIVFKGTMDLQVQLPDIIHFLNASGVKASLEGRTLVISGP